MRAVVGQYCKGVKDALTPDVREGLHLYDTTVNDVKNPAIFVTYHDAQAYPEYLIKFKQAGQGVPYKASQSAPPKPQPPQQPQSGLGRQLQVTVPGNATPGTSLSVTTPTGQTIMYTIPAGAAPGQVLTIAY